MAMRSRAWAWTASLGLLACGGNVVVDGLASGTGGTGASSTTTTGATTSSTSSVTATTSTGTFTTTGTGTSSGVPCLDSCASALKSSVMPCDGLPFTTYTELGSCACTSSACAAACKPDLCAFQPVSASCLMCIQAVCPMQLQDCLAH